MTKTIYEREKGDRIKGKGEETSKCTPWTRNSPLLTTGNEQEGHSSTMMAADSTGTEHLRGSRDLLTREEMSSK